MAKYRRTDSRKKTITKLKEGIQLINAAIVGLGWWGQTLVESVSKNSNKLRFATAVSRSGSDTAKNFSDLHKMNLVQNLGDALGDPNIDAIVLATPHSCTDRFAHGSIRFSSTKPRLPPPRRRNTKCRVEPGNIS